MSDINSPKLSGQSRTDDLAPHKWRFQEIVPWSSAWPWLIAGVFLLALPLIFPSGSGLTIMNQMAITIVFALAYNMLLGQGGMLSFGHAVYMGLGGFFCMHLINRVEFSGWYLPLPLLPIFGGLFGLFFAFLIGSFSTRRAGTVFAMISLGVGELIAACSIIVVAFFGGEEGISGDRSMGPKVFGVDFAQQQEVYYLIVIWLLIATLLMYLFSRTPIGRITNAVRIMKSEQSSWVTRSGTCDGYRFVPPDFSAALQAPCGRSISKS